MVYFSNSYTVLQIIGILFALSQQYLIPIQYRVVAPLICYSAVFFVTAVLVLVELDPVLFFGLTLLSTGISGFCASVLSSGLFSLAGMLPSVYTSALMSGNALAGVTVCVLSIIASVSVDPVDNCFNDIYDGVVTPVQSCKFRVDRSAFGYFVTATAVLLSCIFAFLSLMRLSDIK